MHQVLSIGICHHFHFYKRTKCKVLAMSSLLCVTIYFKFCKCASARYCHLSVSSLITFTITFECTKCKSHHIHMHKVQSITSVITILKEIFLIRIALLFERKNKERVVSVVGVNTTGRSIVIGEELATYDKVIMLEMLED